MSNIKVDLKYANVDMDKILEYKEQVKEIDRVLRENPNDPNKFLGWLELPTSYDKEEFERIKNASQKIQSDSEVFVCIGIGGSYLGAKAVIDSLTSTFYNYKKQETPQILYAGNNISGTYLTELIELIGDRDFSVNVISKSGTTTEPAIAFRVFREILENKYGIDEAKKRIYVTTDKSKGALKQLAQDEGYETFIVPDNIGGRYSVLTAVGLLPIAVAGINIDNLMAGAKDAQDKYLDSDLKYNECYQYAVVRNILNRDQKEIEILVNYEPKMHYFTEWWKQLFGESEGKMGRGIFPAGVDFTTDLHSMGQYIQDGKRHLFETVINIVETNSNLTIKEDEDNLDGLNYLSRKDNGLCKQKSYGRNNRSACKWKSSKHSYKS